MTTRMRNAEKDVLIGDNISAIRRLKGWSLDKLAESIGVTYQQVQKYEKGTNRVAASTLYAIAQCLETDINAFFGVPSYVYKARFSDDPKMVLSSQTYGYKFAWRVQGTTEKGEPKARYGLALTKQDAAKEIAKLTPTFQTEMLLENVEIARAYLKDKRADI